MSYCAIPMVPGPTSVHPDVLAAMHADFPSADTEPAFIPLYHETSRQLARLMGTKNDVVIMDMEAGLEHLGRGTAANMDQFVVVIEPGARSVQTYHNVKRLAKDLGITRVRVVANKIRDDGDEEFIRSAIPAEDLLGFIHYNPDIIDADRQGKSPYDFSPAAIEEIRKIKAILDRDES